MVIDNDLSEYSFEFLLKAPDVDLSNHWRPSTVFLLAQEIAERHSAELGCSHISLAERDSFFVLMRQKFIAKKAPIFMDKINVVTWATVKRTVFPRFFDYYDENGEHICSVSSLWMLCRASDRKILRPSERDIIIPESSRTNLEEPGKLRFEEPCDSVTMRKCLYSDVDYNGHMNNVRYVDWICDLFEAQRFHDEQISEFQVNYISEIKSGEEVSLKLKEDENGFSVVGICSCDNRTAFQATGKWEKRRSS